MLGHTLMDLAAPGAPVLLYGVGDMVSAHSAREAALLEGEGASKKRKTTGGKAPHRGSKRQKGPIILPSGAFLFFLMPLALVAWQVMAVGHLVSMRESLKSIYGKVNSPESQFCVRF
jgi:hypothetical protein